MQRTMIQIAPAPKPKTMAGATLLEVMIAMVIMSIGLIGLASLQLSGVNASNGSEKRTQATMIANDLIERMRANPAGVSAGNYAAVDFSTIDCTNPPPTSCETLSSGAVGCNAQQMANFDAYIAWCNATSLLQSGTVAISCTDNSGSVQACASVQFRRITVTWQTQVDGGTKNKSVSMIFRPVI
ncbi:MAG: type IV pilus modification protein PilV [Gammaproteobacteria bacterium]|nr:type IV pilus modification protein PilV [Gammaproteobacteria bacterium]